MDLILGAPRRRWTREDKLAAVTATFSPGMTVPEVARNFGINSSLLYHWRKKLRAEAGFPDMPNRQAFVPVTVGPEPAGFFGAASVMAGTGTIEISFTDAPQMRITGGVDPALARSLVATLAAR
ncbi:MAG: IS66-like element accessory protein TnpA [Hyphomonas sp.]